MAPISPILKIVLLLFILILLANLIISVVLGHLQHFYNPNIKANYSGFIASVLGIAIIIMFFTIDPIYSEKYGKKIMIAFAGIFAILAVLGLAFEFRLGFFFGAWACIVWLLTALVAGYAVWNQTIDMRAKDQNTSGNAIQMNPPQGSNNSLDRNLNNLDVQTGVKDQPKCCSKQRCGFCCHACCSLTTLLVMALFVSIAIAYYANLAPYPAIGQVYQITNTEIDQKYYVHGYCIGNQHSTRPTIILQHGGGSNSIAFVELGQKLSQNSWKLCSYDRLGYGRSSPIPQYLSVQERTWLTNEVIKKLLESHTNKNIIIGGWSAGVEISQIYAQLYPANVQGIIFLDGYSDYITLMYIYDNKTQVIKANTAGVVGIVRVLEPLGLGFIAGSNPIQNQTTNSYYNAYYKTGYFWESQYYDVSNPTTNTDWLTQATPAGTTAPYPSSQIPLNWADISVPLLVMPAKNTVNSTDKYSPMYYQHAQKYIDKCSNANKLMKVMEGDHAFVLKSPNDVASQIHAFFGPLF